MSKEGDKMFNPNDIFISILGNERLSHLGINLDLYNNFSFRDELYINVVYNGDAELGKLECDNLITLSENRGYYGGALDGINDSLKFFIESDRSIAVIHNFDFLFFYDNPFKNLIVKLIDSKKYFLGQPKSGNKVKPVVQQKIITTRLHTKTGRWKYFETDLFLYKKAKSSHPKK